LRRRPNFNWFRARLALTGPSAHEISPAALERGLRLRIMLDEGCQTLLKFAQG